MQKNRIVASLLFLLSINFGQLYGQTQTQLSLSPSSESHLSPWYVGVTAGVPVGIGTFTSFGADKTRIGYNFGVLMGYRINRIFSTELSARNSSLRMESGRCCENMWLGADGLRYWSAVAGENSWRYGDIYASASLFHAGLHLNISLLPAFGVDSRFRVDVSPAVYYIHSTTTIKDKADKQTLIEGGSASHLGAGGDLTLGYRVGECIALGVYGGGMWYSGNSLDAMPRMEHQSGYTLHAGVKLTYTFGRKNSVAGRTMPVSVVKQEVATEYTIEQDTIVAATSRDVAAAHDEVIHVATAHDEAIHVAATHDEATPRDIEAPYVAANEFPLIYFKFNALSIGNDEAEKVRRIADILQSHPQIQIELRGWSDPIGSPEVNSSISLDRAIELRYRLTKLGVAAERITVKGMGADSTAPQADKARRVETIKR